MPTIPINSIDDPRLEAYRNLKDTNRTRWAGRFIVEGEKLVRRLLDSRFAVDSILLSDRFAAHWDGSASNGVNCFAVPGESIEQLVGFDFHRGILACGVRQPNPSLEAIAPPGDRRTVVVCPDVQDPENLGAILRLSNAFGVDGVLTGPSSADPFSRRVLRVSMGGSLRTPIRESTDVIADMQELKQRLRMELAATVLHPDAESLSSARRAGRFSLVFGSEGHGLRPDVIACCDRRLTIPMHAAADSLNVAVAAGIFLHHFCAVSNLE